MALNPAYTTLKSYTDMLAKNKFVPPKPGGPTAPIPGAPVPGAPKPVTPVNLGAMPNPALPVTPPTQAGLNTNILEGLAGTPPTTQPPANPPTSTPIKYEHSNVPVSLTMDTTPKDTVTYNPGPLPMGMETTTPKTENVQLQNTTVQPETGVTPSTANPTTGSKSDQLYDSVLDQLASGIKDNKPLPGTAASIAQNREAMATYAKNAEARAGATAAQNGSLGQGTANAMGQATRQDVLGQLANEELGNTKMVSDEKQKLIDMATQAGQFGKTNDLEARRVGDQETQFTQTLAQRKDEFDKNFGASESTDYRNQLERLGQDNPVLASKLTNYLLDGKTGALGDFTPDELAQIKTYAADKKTQDTKLQDVYNKILETVPGQISDSTQASNDAKVKAKEETDRQDLIKKLNSIPAGQFLADADFQTLQKSADITRYTEQTIPRDVAGVQDFLRKSPSGIFSLNGDQYRLVAGRTARTGAGTFTNQERHTDYAEVINAAGATKYVYDGKVNDNPPNTVSNDISPFGF